MSLLISTAWFLAGVAIDSLYRIELVGFDNFAVSGFVNCQSNTIQHASEVGAYSIRSITAIYFENLKLFEC